MRTRALITTIAVAVVSCGSGSTSPDTSTSPETSTSTNTPVETSPTVTTIESATTTAEPTSTTVVDQVQVTIADGVVSGPEEVEVALGETVDLWVLSDVDDEVHVHGYDLVFELEGGVPFHLTFPADVPGLFEVEAHTGHTHIFDLRVVG